MLTRYERHHLLRRLILLTVVFIVTQGLFIGINFYITGFLSLAHKTLTANLVCSDVFLFPTLQWLIAQIIIYVIYIYLLWYVTIAMAELLSLSYRYTYGLGMVLWLNSVVMILSLNVFYVPHSEFTYLIRKSLLGDPFTDHQWWIIVMFSVVMSVMTAGLALTNMCISFFRKKFFIRDRLMLGLIVVLFFLSTGQFIDHEPDQKSFASTNQTPNIFIIGFDALRPDHLSFFDPQRLPTPHFDAFLKSSVVFTEAYTPLARTMPSWVSVLTGRYPLHSGVRENNTLVNAKTLGETLPQQLQQRGYETIYATDDRRFNNIDERFGFDQVIGPPGTLGDYLIGTLNDFPLSNLLSPTLLGQLLFPYNHANHAAAYTYVPDNFLQSLHTVLDERQAKPLFLAVHFNISGWPFYWFNDKLAYNADSIHIYDHGIPGADQVLARFLDLLSQHHLLAHALVVVMSDHGVALGLHGDRFVTEKKYSGHPSQMKLKRLRYEDAILNSSMTIEKSQKNTVVTGHFQWNEEGRSLFDPKYYGIDTSYGYGTDVLSLTQYHTLLAIKAYGLDREEPHRVSGRVLLLDIAPTIVDILHLPLLSHRDGLSLKPYLYSTHRFLKDRPIYLESGYSLTDIEQPSVDVGKVVAGSIGYYQLNRTTGLLTLIPPYIDALIKNKQRAILQGDWLLAYYPISERFRWVREKKNKNSLALQPYWRPPYFVWVNLKTGQWTTESHQSLVLHSPMRRLKKALDHFYGREMRNYH